MKLHPLISLRPSADPRKSPIGFPDDGPTDRETIQHLQLLVELFDTDLKPMFDMRYCIKQSTLTHITYNDLWHLFENGQDVTTSDSNPRVYRVLRCTGGRETLAKHGLFADLQAPAYIDTNYLQKSDIRNDSFIVECVSFEFDGQQYGPVQQIFTIRKYDGEKQITSLPIYPLSFSLDRDKIRERLIERGRFYLELSRVEHATHKHYMGLTLDEPHEEVSSEPLLYVSIPF